MIKSPSKELINWYPAKSAARISGLSEDMVNYLCRSKFIVPTGSKNRGRGTTRKYVFSDILLLRIIAKLLEQGISVLRLKKCLAALQKRGGKTNELVTKKFVITNGYEIYFEENEILQMLSSGQLAFAFVIELTNLRKEVSDHAEYTSKVATSG